MTYRILHIAEMLLLSFLAIAFATAMSTITRNWILQPHAIVSNLSATITSAVPMAAHGIASLDTTVNQYMINGKLEDNIRLTLPDSPVDAYTQRFINHMISLKKLNVNGDFASGDDKLNLSQLSPEVAMEKLSERGVKYLHRLRIFDRVEIAVSGTVDLAPCWDWNTKAIYIAFIARYRTALAAMNEVTFLDAIVRHTTLSKEMRALQSIEPAQRTHDQVQRWREFEESLRNPVHDHPSLRIDHINKKVYLNQSSKYFLEDVYTNTLGGVKVDIIMRYQVQSYSGWAPLRDDAVMTSLELTIPHT